MSKWYSIDKYGNITGSGGVAAPELSQQIIDMAKSAEQVAQSCIKRIELIIMTDLPEPSCSSKKPQWRWQVEQVKKKVAERIWPQSSGISIEIKP